jgi:hypothetical protein
VSQLDEFAQDNARHAGHRCSVCALPPDLLREIEDGKLKGHSHQTMSDYLRMKHGERVSYWSIGHHFRQGHKKEVA